MMEVIAEQAQSFIDKNLFDFSEVDSFFRRENKFDEEENLLMYKKDVEDIWFLQNDFHNRLMILDNLSKNIFLKKFIEILSEYREEDIYGMVAHAILERNGVKPNFSNPYGAIPFLALKDQYKLRFYDTNTLKFNFEVLSKKLFKPYLERQKKFLEYLNELANSFDFGKQNAIMTNIKHSSNKVFIVHGRNEAMKYDVARQLEVLGLEPIILHEQSNGNRTIIEKIEKYSDVKFAIIILSDDDHGAICTSNDLNPRARQNVVFEMGYFMGVLGRSNVCCILNNNLLERPSDIDGIVYLDYNGGWKLDLAKELKSADFDIDLNKLMR